MRNILSKLSLLLIMSILVGFDWGGNAFAANAYDQAIAAGVPTDSYIFSLTGPEANQFFYGGHIYYSTTSQQNIDAKKVWSENEKTMYFYVPASDNPVSFGISINYGNGLKSCVNTATDTPVPHYVQFTTVKASTIDVNQVIACEYDAVANVRIGRLEITVDEPGSLKIQNYSAGVLETYTAEDFSDGKLTILYDPETEGSWNIALDGSDKIYQAFLNGSKLNRSQVVMYNSVTSLSYLSGYEIVLDKAVTTHKLDIKTQ